MHIFLLLYDNSVEFSQNLVMIGTASPCRVPGNEMWHTLTIDFFEDFILLHDNPVEFLENLVMIGTDIRGSFCLVILYCCPTENTR